MSDRIVLKDLTVFVRTRLSDYPGLYRFFSGVYHRAIALLERVQIGLRFPGVVFYSRPSREAQRDAHEGFNSQYGQETYLLKMRLIPERGGIFVDVGCNHPELLSNSWGLEKQRGYCGIAIDPLNLAGEWARLRPKTRFVNALISKETQLIDFVEVKGDQSWQSMLSGVTGSIDLTARNVDYAVHKMATRPLDDILLDERVQHIDVLFIDVEGHEMDVLRSTNFDKNRPGAIVIENFGRMAKQNEVRNYLIQQNYRFAARIWISDDVFVDGRVSGARSIAEPSGEFR